MPNVPVAPPAEQPSSIRTAVILMYVGAALAVIGTVILVLSRNSIRDAFADDDPTLTKTELDSLVTGLVVGSIIFAVISVALWIWLAFATGDGRACARV